MKSFALLPLAAFAAAYSLPILAATDDANNSDIERITVKGRAQSMYRIDDGSVAMKTATPLERTPQSVQILPLSLIEDQAATEVTDLYRSISGVSQYNYASVTFRGFRQNDVRYDGVAGEPDLILTDDTASPWYTATAESRPLVRGVRIRVTPPGYSGRTSRLLPEGVGDVTGLAGSTVRVSVGLGGAPAADGWLRVAWQTGGGHRCGYGFFIILGCLAFFRAGLNLITCFWVELILRQRAYQSHAKAIAHGRIHGSTK